MKKIAFGLALLFFVFGCASTQMVTESLFVSKNPDVSVHVDPAFKYIGSTKYTYSSDSINSSQKLFNQEESFVFIKEKSAENIVKSMVVLAIRKISTAFVSNYFTTNKTFLEYGMITLGSDKYEYATQITYPSMQGGVTRYLKDNGTILPSCMIKKSYFRSIYQDTAMLINYYEGLPDLPRKCQDWEDKEILYDDQRDFIKAFSKRSEKSFKVIVDATNYTNSPPPQKSTKENWSETAEKIKALGELLEKGLITQEEYNDKKRKLLEQF